MFSLLRFLLSSFVVSVILTAVALGAEEVPPPLPPVNTNNSVLKGLGALMNGTGKMTQKSTVPERVPLKQTERQENRVPEQLPTPSTVSQASFTTMPLAKLPQKTVEAPEIADATQPSQQTNEAESAPAGDLNETLNKPLFSRKTVNAEETTETEEVIKMGNWKNKLAKPEFTSVVSVGGSLLIVIAAFFLLAIILRKVSPKGNRPLPQEVFECLGRYYLTQKHQVQLLRVGSRIVLVSVMPDAVKTLSEITDTDEAIALLGLCRRLDVNSATEMFRKTVASISEEEFSRPRERPVVTHQHTRQSSASLDLYSDPDESLAAILAKGKLYRG